MNLYYIRHGEPIYDPDSLTEKGHEQAALLVPYLLRCGLDRVYSSTSNRAMQTAQPTCDAMGIEMQLLDFANEKYAYRDFSIGEGNKRGWLSGGDWGSRALFATEEIKKLGFEWYKHESLLKYNYEKGVRRVYDECDNFLLSLGYEHERYMGRYKIVAHSDENVALFAHEGFGKIFLSCLLDMPYPYLCNYFCMPHSSVTRIKFLEREGYAVPIVSIWSSVEHLRKE